MKSKYLSKKQEFVECKICHKIFSGITPSHCKYKHNISLPEYIHKFDLSMGETTSRATAIKRSRNTSNALLLGKLIPFTKESRKLINPAIYTTPEHRHQISIRSSGKGKEGRDKYWASLTPEQRSVRSHNNTKKGWAMCTQEDRESWCANISKGKMGRPRNKHG